MNKINSLIQSNISVLLDSLLSRFFYELKNNEIKKALKTLQIIENSDFSKNIQAYEMQVVFLELIEQIRKNKPITYSELAQRINQKYNLNFPESGNQLSIKLAPILGNLSIISYTNAQVLISIYIINKKTLKPGAGLISLKEILNNILEINDNEFCEELERFKLDTLFSKLVREN